MPLSRQVRHFQQSRESWKRRALDSQKQVRFYSQKIVNLEKSREQWRDEALDQRQEIKKLKTEIENLQKKKKLRKLSRQENPTYRSKSIIIYLKLFKYQ